MSETETDGIEVLEHQHERVGTLMDLVQASGGAARAEHFTELRRLLAVHETAEALALRPLTRRRLKEGTHVAKARLREETAAKKLLARLQRAGAGSAEFEESFGQLKTAVHQHALHEEKIEFDRLRRVLSRAELSELANALRTAEAGAPTRAHPAARSTGAVALLGPFASVLDRSRDALRSALGRA